MNRRALFWILGGLALVVYMSYSWGVPAFLSKHTVKKAVHLQSWKKKSFVDIDPEVKKRIPKAVVNEMEVSFMMDGNRVSFH